MNVERCIALHNEILKHGWIGSGRSAAQFEDGCKTWFESEAIHDQTEAVRAVLVPDVVRFLEHARIVCGPAVDLSFFFWVRGLAGPEFMFEFEELLVPYSDSEDEEDVEDEKNRFIVLYMMNSFAGHIMGLV